MSSELYKEAEEKFKQAASLFRLADDCLKEVQYSAKIMEEYANKALNNVKELKGK